MKGRIGIKLVVSILLIALGMNSVCFGEFVPATDVQWLDNTPSENVFRVEGDNREFILLDITKDAKSKFFVLAKEYYSDRPFDPRDKSLFDPTDGQNIAGWLNGSFLKYGNLVSSGETMKFPQGIIDHINKKHIWITDGEYAVTEELGTYGVSLMSQEEMLRYKDKFGVDDGLKESKLFPSVYGWWVRSQNDPNTRSKITFRYDLEKGTNFHSWRASSTGSICTRPCFYLDEGFFKEVRIDTKSMGLAVRNAIRQTYLKEELTEAYTVKELQDLFGYKADVNIKVTNMTDANGKKLPNLMEADKITTTISAKSFIAGENEVVLMQVLYGEDNCPITFNVKAENLTWGVEKDLKIDISLNSRQREKGAYLKTYLIMPGVERKTVSNAVRTYLSK